MGMPLCRCLGEDRRNRFVGVIAILGLWANWFIWTGSMKSLATLLPTLRDQFQTYTWVIGWMIVIMDVTADCTGPLAAPLRRHFGVRICLMVGGLMVGLAFIIASSSSTVVMAVVLAVLAGPGLGIGNVLGRELIGQCFSSGGISTAFAIAQSGDSFAYIILPPLTQFFLDTYGWRDALLLLGAIFFHLTVCAALFRRPSSSDNKVIKSDYSVIPDDCEDGEEEEHQHGKEVKKSSFRALCERLNITLLFNRSYWCVAVINIVVHIGCTGWAVYFVPHAQAKGFTPQEAVILTTIMGMSRIVAALTLGPLMDKIKIVGSKGFMGIALMLVTVYYLIDPWLTSFWLNAVNVTIFGCSTFLLWLLVDVLLCEMVSIDELGSAFGWMSMTNAVFVFFLLYLPGLAFDLGGSYTIAFMLFGGLHIFAIVALVVLVDEQRRK